jgi:hypothetical protein
MENQKAKAKSSGWSVVSLFLAVISLALFGLYSVRTSSLVMTVARGGSADRESLHAVDDWKTMSVAFAIVGMVLSIIGIRQSPNWLGRASFLLALLACCTIPLVI